jgi:hypothetical protein
MCRVVLMTSVAVVPQRGISLALERISDVTQWCVESY